MREEVRQLACGVPREKLWDFLADYDNVVRLGAPDASAHLATGSAQTGDSVYEAELSWYGSVSHFTAHLASASRPTTLTWDTTTGMGRSWLRFDLEPAQSSTVVSVTLHHDGSESARVLEALAWGILQTTLERTLIGLSELQL